MSSKCLLILVLTFFKIHTYSQTGLPGNTGSNINESFIKFYNTPGRSLEPGAFVLDNNFTITCGNVRSSTPPYYSAAYLMKIDPLGKIVWQKTFGGNATQGLRNLIKLKDGNFIATGVDAPSTSIRYYLLKFDGNGNIIWRKDFGTNNNNENFSVRCIAEAVDGSLILTAYNMENNPMGNFRILFARFDAQGNVLLSKFFVPPYEAYGAVMSPNSLVIKDGFTYIAGNVVINSLKGLLMKVNNTSGELVWSKVYDFNNGEADFYQAFNYSAEKLCLLGVNRLNPIDTSIIYMVDTSGIPSSANYLRCSPGSVGENLMYGMATLDKDKNLIWTMKNFSSQAMDMTISKVHPINGVRWSKEYKQLTNHPRVLGIQIGKDSSIFTAGYKSNNDGYLQYYLTKFTKDGESGCVPDNLQTSFGMGVTNFRNVVFSPVNKTLINKSGTNTVIGDLLSLADSLCVNLNICTAIKLSGPDTLCSITDTIKIKVEKSYQDNVTPQFLYDSSKVRFISFADSIVKFMALQHGFISIKAISQTSCETFQDSLTLKIFPSASQVSLGKDTFICDRQSLDLSANLQYPAYTWQDNSRLPNFTATTPGKYYVTVRDYCHKINTDTIIIAPAKTVLFNLLRDYTMCDRDTVSIQLPTMLSNSVIQPDNNISYANNMIKAWPAVSQNFYIQATTYEGCVISDSLRIKVNYATPILLSGNTSVCEGDTVTLNAPAGLVAYTWNDGSSAEKYKVTASGKYWVTVVNSNNCTSSDTANVLVNIKPTLFLGNDTTICPNQNYSIKAGNSFSTYQWQDGSRASVFTTANIGMYWVTVSDINGCSNMDTLRITGYKAIPANLLKATDSVCMYEPKVIAPDGNWSAYLWSNGMQTPNISVTSAGVYSLQVWNSAGCFGRDTIKVVNKECIEGIWFPSAFTPNTDGKNDLFKPVFHTRLAAYNFTIYNRFGELVYREIGSPKGWDGKFNGQTQDTGTYVWYCIYQWPGQREQSQKGTVLLLR